MLASLIQGMVNSGSSAAAPAPAPYSSVPAPGTVGGATTGCATGYYNSSVPSSDPCAIYTPTGTSGSTADQLLTALGQPPSSSLTGALCPTVNANCGAGFTYQPGVGTDANGCQLAGQCISNTSSSTCPAISVDCSPGYTSQPQTGLDINGCQLANQCIQNSTGNVCQALSTICNSGYAYQPGVGTDVNGCPLAGQCVLSNQSAGTILTASTSLFDLAPTNVSGAPVTPSVTSGVAGNIVLTSNGTTFYASTQDTQNNSETAGFIGSDTFGSQPPQSLAGQLCQSRPWASDFLSAIIPPSFFDGLCTWQGYQVGVPVAAAPAATTNPSLQQVVVQQAPAPVAATTSASVIAPSVEIWAVPSSVPLGTRTSIFWNTQGVTSCTETSPDGSFSQNSLEGGASTVPLTGATTYGISCLAPDGTPITDYVTVNLSL